MMASVELLVQDGMVVSMDYTLRLDDGEIIDASDGTPLDFLQGAGQIIPGLEREIYGMKVDDARQIVVAPADGYGDVDTDAFQLVPLSLFPPTMELTPGLALQMRDQNGQVLPVVVAEIRPDGVLLDFNHPLAGETLHFDIKIVGLRPATGEELSHGHAHGAGHNH